MFLGKPGPPIDPQVIASSNQEMLLSWSPPSSDGGSPIKAYRIEKSFRKPNIWSLALLVSSDLDQCQAWVPELHTGKTYEFRIFALNKYGTSDPSRSSPPRICRAANGKNRDSFAAFLSVTLLSRSARFMSPLL